MTAPKRSADDLGEGVVFARGDCASLATRAIIVFVDAFVICVALFVFAISSFLLFPAYANVVTTLSLLAFMAVYLIFAGATSFGTIGYLLTGVKIVDLRGRPPSYLRMASRPLLWWIFAQLHPVFILLSFFWIANDRRKQSLPDKLSGTYVVKKRAKPIRVGRVRAEHYFVMGLSVLFPEVEYSARAKSPSPADNDRSR